MKNCNKGYKGDCCCLCVYHHKYYSHPWVNGLPTYYQLGWICFIDDIGVKNITVSTEHGCCEMFRRG